jgi:phenylpropionate dioxygenase-like ring-hydroxylating dioxygenase large terminal subunit
MVNLLREYWLPALQSEELSANDVPPLRVRFLGENLIAFRATSGKVGIVANSCPHRGASLFFGRNEEEGLRCVYHGWKFDVDGNCVDMPSEPAESNFKSKVHAVAYHVMERNGVIWLYMGNRAEPPPLPDHEWNTVPEGHYAHMQELYECNWAQAVETGIDPAHTFFLHSRLNPDAREANANVPPGTYVGNYHHDHAPIVNLKSLDFGLITAARRTQDEEQYYWRTNLFLTPFYTMFSGGGDGGAYPAHAWVPLDDHHTMSWSIRWNPTRPLPENLLNGGFRNNRMSLGYLPGTSDFLGRWLSVANKTNDYMIDYEAQKTIRFSGVPTNPLQDAAMAEGMGYIRAREQEHLGTGDALVTQFRRRMINNAIALKEQGVLPYEIDNPEVYKGQKGIDALLPKDADFWEETAAETDGITSYSRQKLSARARL